jgi:hypothetical protein
MVMEVPVFPVETEGPRLVLEVAMAASRVLAVSVDAVALLRVVTLGGMVTQVRKGR